MRLITCLSCAVLSLGLSACGGGAKGATAQSPAASSSQEPAMRAGALQGGKIDVRTIDNDEVHSSDVVLALLPFKNNSRDKELDGTGAALSDLLSAQLASRKGFRLVERSRIEAIMDELHLGDAGPVDQATAVRIGGMLGANVMAFGSFTTLGKKVILNIRLVKVETSEIFGGVTERAEDVNQLDVLAERGAKKLADAISLR